LLLLILYIVYSCRFDSKDEHSKAKKTPPRSSKGSSSDFENNESVSEGEESLNRESNDEEPISREPYSHQLVCSGRRKESIMDAVQEVKKEVILAAAAPAAVSVTVLEGKDKLLPASESPLIATSPVVCIAGEGLGRTTSLHHFFTVAHSLTLLLKGI
jgi:hypothetical protein